VHPGPRPPGRRRVYALWASRHTRWKHSDSPPTVCVCFAELLPEALASGATPAWAAQMFLVGAGLFAILKFAVPDIDSSRWGWGPNLGADKGHEVEGAEMTRALKKAVLMAVCIALHNLPEGVAVYASSLKGLQLGVPLAVGDLVY
jgi:zinc transporter ZupT